MGEFVRDLPIRIVDASAWSGNMAARNLGVDGSAGDIILSCDQDDLVSPLWIASHAELLSNTDVSVGRREMATDVSDSETCLCASGGEKDTALRLAAMFAQ